MRGQSQAVDIVHNYANGLFDEVFCNEISGPGVWWPGPISGGPMNYSGYVAAKRGNGGNNRNCDEGCDQSVLKRGHATAIALQAKPNALQVKPSLYNIFHLNFLRCP